MAVRPLKYVNSKGDAVEFGGERPRHLFWGDTDIFNTSAEYQTIGGAISSWRTPLREMSLLAKMRGGSQEELERLVDVVSYDTRVNSPGTLWAGDSFMRCYIGGFSLDNYWQLDSMADVALTVVSDEPVWVRSVSVTVAAVERAAGDGMDYPHDYPHDYLYSAGASTVVENPFQLPAKCDIAISGPCVSPYVIIGGNRYQVDAVVERGQILFIQGFGTPDAYIRHTDGTVRSVFDKRVRQAGAQPFAPIPVGSHNVSWSGAYNFEVTMYEERTSPCWS